MSNPENFNLQQGIPAAESGRTPRWVDVFPHPSSQVTSAAPLLHGDYPNTSKPGHYHSHGPATQAAYVQYATHNESAPLPSSTTPSYTVRAPQPFPLDLTKSDSEPEFPPANQLYRLYGNPTPKIAGSTHLDPKGKGKVRAMDEQPTASSSSRKRKAVADADPQPTAKKQKGGRAAGVANYSYDDVDMLLHSVKSVLPTGGDGWILVEKLFNANAAKVKRPQRSSKSLELKFKMLLKTPKPTGDAECPPHILLTHEIEEAIQVKVASQVLDDSEIADAIDCSDADESNDDGLPARKKIEPPVSFVARRPATTERKMSTRQCARSSGQDLLANISSALDPSFRQSRRDELSVQTMQANQLLQLSSQLRDAQRRIDTLNMQLHEAERRCNDALRRADRNEMMGFFSQHLDYDPMPEFMYRRRHNSGLLRTPSSRSHRYSGHRRRRASRDGSPSTQRVTRNDKVYSPRRSGSQSSRVSRWSPSPVRSVPGPSRSAGTDLFASTSSIVSSSGTQQAAHDSSQQYESSLDQSMEIDRDNDVVDL